MVQLDQVKLIIPRGKLSALSARIEQKNKKTTQLPVSSVTASCCKLLFAVRASKQTCLIRLGSSTKRSGSFYSDRCFSSERRWGPCICHICEVIHQPARCDAYMCDEEGEITHVELITYPSVGLRHPEHLPHRDPASTPPSRPGEQPRHSPAAEAHARWSQHRLLLILIIERKQNHHNNIIKNYFCIFFERQMHQDWDFLEVSQHHRLTEPINVVKKSLSLSCKKKKKKSDVLVIQMF